VIPQSKGERRWDSEQVGPNDDLFTRRGGGSDESTRSDFYDAGQPLDERLPSRPPTHSRYDPVGPVGGSYNEPARNLPGSHDETMPPGFDQEIV